MNEDVYLFLRSVSESKFERVNYLYLYKIFGILSGHASTISVICKCIQELIDPSNVIYDNEILITARTERICRRKICRLIIIIKPCSLKIAGNVVLITVL